MTAAGPRIALACAARRGLLFLERLAALVPAGTELVVFSFREEPHEPPFVDDIAALCRRLGAAFHETRDLGSDEWEGVWAQGFDLLLAVSWRYLVPPAVYARARRGAFVFHDSLLPEYRGFSPTVWAILNGEDHTGVTLFAMAEGMDTGDVVEQRRVPIGPDETIAEVVERVTATYLELLEHNLPALLDGSAELSAQDASRTTYCCRLLPDDCAIDWRGSTRRAYDLIRGYGRPYPGAHTRFGGRRLTVWEARRLEEGAPPWAGRVPGRVAEVRHGEGSVVLTGDGALLLTRVQPEGGEEVCAADILNRLSHTLGPEG